MPHDTITETAATTNAFEFLAQAGRFPRLGDPVPPWYRQGWLLLYVIEAKRIHPGIPDRYGYHLATLDARRLLDAPIPRLEFCSAFEGAANAGRQATEKWVDIAERGCGSWSGFSALVDWLAFALAVSRKPSTLDDKTQEELYRTVNLEPYLLFPSDYLGNYLSATKVNKYNKSAFYPTPHTVVEMMVCLTMGEGDQRAATVCDPCVGTGRMLLHASNYSLRLYGQDIDPLVVRICQINGALYAPWLAFPLPEGLFAAPGPPPPPAPLPVPVEYEPPAEVAALRVDDLGQGLLFGDFAPAAKRRRR